MVKKLLFIPFCLSLFCSSFLHSQETIEQNVFDQLTSETIKTVTQEIEKLSPEEKLALKENLLETIEHFSKEEINAHASTTSIISAAISGTVVSLQLCVVCCICPCVIVGLTYIAYTLLKRARRPSGNTV